MQLLIYANIFFTDWVLRPLSKFEIEIKDPLLD